MDLVARIQKAPVATAVFLQGGLLAAHGVMAASVNPSTEAEVRGQIHRTGQIALISSLVVAVVAVARWFIVRRSSTHPDRLLPNVLAGTALLVALISATVGLRVLTLDTGSWVANVVFVAVLVPITVLFGVFLVKRLKRLATQDRAAFMERSAQQRAAGEPRESRLRRFGRRKLPVTIAGYALLLLVPSAGSMLRWTLVAALAVVVIYGVRSQANEPDA